MIRVIAGYRLLQFTSCYYRLLKIKQVTSYSLTIYWDCILEEYLENNAPLSGPNIPRNYCFFFTQQFPLILRQVFYIMNRIDCLLAEKDSVCLRSHGT